jgi:hypothetical protein
MPVTTPGITNALLPNLISVGLLGTEVPKLARGIANGVAQWVPQIRVNTTDAGSAGSGSNIPLPVTVANPILLANLTSGMSVQGLLGVFVPPYLLGLTNGLCAAFLQMAIKTTHVGVGSGAGVAKFTAPPARTSMINGFNSAGLKGDSAARKASAIAQGLDLTFASLLLPVAIVGSASPSPGTGVGTGSIV